MERCEIFEIKNFLLTYWMPLFFRVFFCSPNNFSHLIINKLNISTWSSQCSFFTRICVKVPAKSSSTLWLIPTDTSTNFARNVHAKHFPSVDKAKKKAERIKFYKVTQMSLHKFDLPWLEIARDLAKSILFPTRIQQRDLSKSMSWRRLKKYSARVNEALSTTE